MRVRLVKIETTTKDTIYSPGAMLMCLKHSRNSNDMEMLSSESALIDLMWPHIHLDELYAGEQIFPMPVGRDVVELSRCSPNQKGLKDPKTNSGYKTLVYFSALAN